MKILILANNDVGLYKFRKELIQQIVKKSKYKEGDSQVFISLPKGGLVPKLEELNCKFIETPIDRRGINPLRDLKLLLNYHKMIKNIRPDIVLTYTIKPNIYGGITCANLKIPYIATITGLGTAVEKKGFLQVITLNLYRIGLKNVNTVFFQNQDNLSFFQDRGLCIGKHRLVPGSGVNLTEYETISYPTNETIEFLFVARIMKEKGIEHYLNAAKVIKNKYRNTKFHVCGACEQDYIEQINALVREDIIIYHGLVEDMAQIYNKVHCVIHPTYYPEGLSNVLLEASSCGRPVITTNRSGCKEVVDEGKNGFLIKERSTSDLIEKIEKFIQMSWEDKKKMGLNGRKKVEKEFNRETVVNQYLKEIETIY